MKYNKVHQSVFALVGIAALITVAFSGCTQKPNGKTEAGNAQPIIAVSILPQSYFVERIGGDSVQSLVLVGPGQNPHSYEPSPKQMEELSRASAWILSHTDFEIGLKPKIASLYPSLLIVDGTEGVQFRMLEAHSHEEEGHVDEKNGEEMTAAGNSAQTMEMDRHTWLGRENAKIMARHIKDTLTKLLPENAALYESRYNALAGEIDSLFNQLDADLAPLRGTKVFVFHPAFGYFFDEFGIQQEAIETGGKEPSAQTLAQIIQEAKAEQVRVIFVQAQFPTTAAKTIAESLNAQVVPLDPLAQDWMNNIKLMGEALKKTLK